MALTEQQLRDLISINLQTGSKITAIKHKEVENALVDAIFNLSTTFNNFVTTEALPYEVREIDMPNNSITLYFEPDGRGKMSGIFEKWAICNGQNGTQARAGKTPIGYGGGYVLGQTGGSETHKLTKQEMPIHSHSEVAPDGDSSHPGGSSGYSRPNGSQTLQSGPEGGDQPHNNMQPYIVTLFIQRIPAGL